MNDETGIAAVPAEADAVKYASFNQRCMASMIDTVLVLICLTPLFHMVEPVFDRGHDLQGFIQKLGAPGLLPDEIMVLFHDFFITQGFLQVWVYNNLFQFTFLGVVCVLFWRKRGATPGKLLLNMKIVDEKTLQPPSRIQCIIRYLGYFISILPLMLGFFWVAFNKKRQGFHDMLASTVVIVPPKPQKEST